MLVTLLRVAMAVAGVPLTALMALVATGQAAPLPALIAAIAIVLAALALALVWINDLRLLADVLHLAGTGEAAGPGAILPLSLTPRVLGEIAFVTQTLGERSEQVDRLQRAEEFILERLPDPLIVLGPDRQIRRANAAARQAFGDEIAAVLRHPVLRAAIERAYASSDEAPQTAEISLPVPIPREVAASIASLDSPATGGRGALLVLSDRTRERAVERMRADFVANASHELRTPLASVIGFIDTLRGPAADDPPAQQRFLDIMAEQAARMNRVIDDLLSLSRIELSEHQVPSDAVDLPEMIERMVDGFEIRLAQKRIRLHWQRPEMLPAVLGDEDQLEQVFQNLLDNAVKYGREEGNVTVGLELVAAGGRYGGKPGVALWVEDDGAGIAREHLGRLTERFYRVDAGRSRAVGGTGLGLAIVKHVINRHRGQLLIDSEPGRGSRFTVWLPLA